MKPDIEIEGDSPPAIALVLLHMVARAEGKVDDKGMIAGCDRRWILDTYAECLDAALGERIPEDDEDDDDEDEDEAEDEDDEDDEDEDEEDEDDDEEEGPLRPA